MHMQFNHLYAHPYEGRLIVLLLILIAAAIVFGVIATSRGRSVFEWSLTGMAAGFVGVFLLGAAGLFLGVGIALIALLALPETKQPMVRPASGRGAFCSSCGSPNIPGKPFCANCGAAQDIATVATPMSQTQPTELDASKSSK